MNAKETLELISKQWCSLNDLIKLTGLGKNSASKLKSEIRIDLLNKGYLLPAKLLPMNEVVNYLKININYLQKMAKENLNQIQVILVLMQNIKLNQNTKQPKIRLNQRKLLKKRKIDSKLAIENANNSVDKDILNPKKNMLGYNKDDFEMSL